MKDENKELGPATGQSYRRAARPRVAVLQPLSSLQRERQAHAGASMLVGLEPELGRLMSEDALDEQAKSFAARLLNVARTQPTGAR